jgi:hypothetical protein
MTISATKPTREVVAVDVAIDAAHLSIVLEDGRMIQLPYHEIPWLRWLAQASREQRAHWTLEPGGFAIYWPDPDDGIEIRHLLTTTPLK